MECGKLFWQVLGTLAVGFGLGLLLPFSIRAMSYVDGKNHCRYCFPKEIHLISCSYLSDSLDHLITVYRRIEGDGILIKLLHYRNKHQSEAARILLSARAKMFAHVSFSHFLAQGGGNLPAGTTFGTAPLFGSHLAKL